MKKALDYETAKALLTYDPSSGNITIIKTGRVLTADEYGSVLVYDPSIRKSHKIKIGKLAYLMGYGILPEKDERVLHKNLDETDCSLKNLAIVTAQEYKEIKEAYRNLSSAIRYNQHPKDQYSYILHWYEDGFAKTQVIHDAVNVKRAELALRLRFSKILTKYCIF